MAKYEPMSTADLQDLAGRWVHANETHMARELLALRATIAEQAATITRLTREKEAAWDSAEYNARRAEQAEAERDALTARVAKLREWMAEYPNDKYTGTWWLAEFDRICKEQP